MILTRLYVVLFSFWLLFVITFLSDWIIGFGFSFWISVVLVSLSHLIVSCIFYFIPFFNKEIPRWIAILLILCGWFLAIIFDYVVFV